MFILNCTNYYPFSGMENLLFTVKNEGWCKDSASDGTLRQGLPNNYNMIKKILLVFSIICVTLLFSTIFFLYTYILYDTYVGVYAYARSNAHTCLAIIGIC